MIHGFVMGRPQPRVGRDGDQKAAARTQYPPHLASRLHVLLQVLEHVVRNDQVEARFGKR
jgi:hypothetical protein